MKSYITLDLDQQILHALDLEIKKDSEGGVEAVPMLLLLLH